MKVTIKHEAINEAYFEDVAFGGVFYYQGDIWMKIPLLAQDADDDADYVNAIELGTGEPENFNSCTKVILPKNTDFIFEY